MADEMKPEACPLCAGQSTLFDSPHPQHPTLWWIACDVCRLESRNYENMAEYLGDWSRRAKPVEAGWRPDYKTVEQIVYHAMAADKMDHEPLEALKAASPSVERNYRLLYLSNAVDAILGLRPSPPEAEGGSGR